MPTDFERLLSGESSFQDLLSPPKPPPTTFDPEGADYDYSTAERYGIQADETGHWPSRVEFPDDEAQSIGLPPRSGIILKGRNHPTWDKTAAGEKEAGFNIMQGEDGRYYSVPAQAPQGQPPPAKPPVAEPVASSATDFERLLSGETTFTDMLGEQGLFAAPEAQLHEARPYKIQQQQLPAFEDVEAEGVSGMIGDLLKAGMDEVHRSILNTFIATEKRGAMVEPTPYEKEIGAQATQEAIRTGEDYSAIYQRLLDPEKLKAAKAKQRAWGDHLKELRKEFPKDKEIEKRIEALPTATQRYLARFIQMSPQMGFIIASGILAGGGGAGVAAATQIMGSTAESVYEETGDAEKALAAGAMNAMMQAPLEALGAGRILKFWNPQKQIINKLRDIAAAAGTEWFTEFAQGVPDHIVNVWAMEPDMEKLKQLDAWVSALSQSAYEGLLTAPWALLGLAGSKPSKAKKGEANLDGLPDDVVERYNKGEIDDAWIATYREATEKIDRVGQAMRQRQEQLGRELSDAEKAEVAWQAARVERAAEERQRTIEKEMPDEPVEIWEQSREEYVKSRVSGKKAPAKPARPPGEKGRWTEPGEEEPGIYADQEVVDANAEHFNAVFDALSKGYNVPDKALANYPLLLAQKRASQRLQQKPQMPPQPPKTFERPAKKGEGAAEAEILRREAKSAPSVIAARGRATEEAARKRKAKERMPEKGRPYVGPAELLQRIEERKKPPPPRPSQEPPTKERAPGKPWRETAPYKPPKVDWKAEEKKIEGEKRETETERAQRKLQESKTAEEQKKFFEKEAKRLGISEEEASETVPLPTQGRPPRGPVPGPKPAPKSKAAGRTGIESMRSTLEGMSEEDRKKAIEAAKKAGLARTKVGAMTQKKTPPPPRPKKSIAEEAAEVVEERRARAKTPIAKTVEEDLKAVKVKRLPKEEKKVPPRPKIDAPIESTAQKLKDKNKGWERKSPKSETFKKIHRARKSEPEEVLKEYESRYGKKAAPVLVKKGDSKKGALIHPSTKIPGRWQLTYWDERGFSGDTNFASKEKAIGEAYDEGFQVPAPKLFDEVSATDKFIEGNERADMVQKENAVRMMLPDVSKKLGRKLSLDGIADGFATFTIQDEGPAKGSTAVVPSKEIGYQKGAEKIQDAAQRIIDNWKAESTKPEAIKNRIEIRDADKKDYELVDVDVAALDEAWKKDPEMRIGKKGENEIGNRLSMFKDYLETGKPIEASTVSIDKNGVPQFVNGRHRFAVMRDMGLKTIPVAISKQSMGAAERAGIVEGKKPEATFDEMVQDAARWRSAAMEADRMYDPEDTKARMKHSDMTTKGDLDAYLKKKYGLNDADARQVSNELTRQAIEAEEGVDVKEFAGEPWADAALKARQGQREREPSVFEWDEGTKLEDLPKRLQNLIPDQTMLDDLDQTNQIDHVRFRVQHEIDIYEDEGKEESGLTAKEYRNAKKFLQRVAEKPMAKKTPPPKAKPPKPKPKPGTEGLAWVKGQQRYITDVREIKRGKKKGGFEVTLPNGKKVKVGKDDIIRMPGKAEDKEGAAPPPKPPGRKEVWEMTVDEYLKSPDVRKDRREAALQDVEAIVKRLGRDVVEKTGWLKPEESIEDWLHREEKATPTWNKGRKSGLTAIQKWEAQLKKGALPIFKDEEGGKYLAKTVLAYIRGHRNGWLRKGESLEDGKFSTFAAHKKAVEAALKQGKPVPDSVLADSRYAYLRGRPPAKKTLPPKPKVAEGTNEKTKTVTTDLPGEEAEQTTPKEQKQYLIAQIDEAIKTAPKTGPVAPSILPDKQTAALRKMENRIEKERNRLEEAAASERARRRKKGDTSTDIELTHPTSPELQRLLTRYQFVKTELFKRQWAKHGTVTIKVPGDGVFTVLNSKEALNAFKKDARSFPATEPKPFTIKAPKPGKLTKRITAPGLEYYNEFAPRKGGLVENADGRNYMNNGFFSDGGYIVKLNKKTKPKKGLKEEGPDMAEFVKDKSKRRSKKASIIGEFFISSENAGELGTDVALAHIRSNDGKLNEAFKTSYIDSVLTMHPDATVSLFDQSGAAMAIFRDPNGEIVGIVMPMRMSNDTGNPLPHMVKLGYERVTGKPYDGDSFVTEQHSDPKEPETEADQKSKAKLIDTLKNDKGESEVFNALVNYSARMVARGYHTMSDFVDGLKKNLGKLYEKVAKLAPRAFIEAKRLLRNQRGGWSDRSKQQAVEDSVAEYLKKAHDIEWVPNYRKLETEAGFSDTFSESNELAADLRQHTSVRETDRAMKWYHNAFSLPYWLAKRYGSIRHAVETEIAAQESRSQELTKDYDGELGRVQDEMGKDATANAQLRDLIWEWDGKRFPESEVPTNWYKPLVKGEDIQINPKHYEEVRAYLKKQGVPDKAADAFVVIRQKLDEKFADAERWMRVNRVDDPNYIQEYRSMIDNVHNYFPHRRWGSKAIVITNKETGKTVYREHYSPWNFVQNTDEKVHERTAKWLRDAIKSGELKGKVSDYEIQAPKKVRQLPDQLFFQVPVEHMQQLVQAAGRRLEASRVDTEADRLMRVEGLEKAAAYKKARATLRADMEKALSKAVADVFKQRGWGQHTMKRENIPGFDKEDIFGSLFDYLAGYAGFKTKIVRAREHHKSLTGISARERPEEYTYLSNYIKDVLENQGEVDRAVDMLRGAFFVKYLGFVVKSGIVNSTQNFVLAAPTLSQYTNKNAEAIIVKAMKDVRRAVTSKEAWTNKKVEYPGLKADEQRAITELVEQGAATDLFLRELKGSMPGRGRYGRMAKKFIDRSGIFMQLAEKWNRSSTGLAAYRVGRDELGMSEEQAIDFAKEVIYDSHFLYGKMNLPSAMRGGPVRKLIRSAYTFRTFSHNYLSALAHMLRNQQHGAFARSLRNVTLLGGLASFPFFKALSDAVMWALDREDEDAMTKIIGYMPEKWMRDLTVYGIPGVFGYDLSGSLGIDIPRNVGEIAGVPYAAWEDFVRMRKSFKAGQYWRAAAETPFTPIPVRNAMRGWELYDMGQYSRSGMPLNLYGEREPLKLTPAEAFGKIALGFQPARVASGYKAFEATRKMREAIQDKKKDFADRYVNAFRRGDRKTMRKIVKDVNKNNMRARKNQEWHKIIDLSSMVERRVYPQDKVPLTMRRAAKTIAERWK